MIYLEIILNRSGGDGLSFPETLNALSSPVRRDILLMLKTGRLSAGDIAQRFDMTQATISYHLAQLKKAKLVFETRVKNQIYYELNVSVLEEIMLWLSQFSQDNGGSINE